MLIGALSQYFFGFTIFILSCFLILLVLVQRGRGGGLTGALGGPGGQSAFGTKAGDLFTRITIGVASVWILLCASAVYFLKEAALPETNVGATSAMSENSDSGLGTSSGTTTGIPNINDLKLPAPTNTPATGTPATGTPATGTPATEGAPETPPATTPESAAPANGASATGTPDNPGPPAQTGAADPAPAAPAPDKQ